MPLSRAPVIYLGWRLPDTSISLPAPSAFCKAWKRDVSVPVLIWPFNPQGLPSRNFTARDVSSYLTISPLPCPACAEQGGMFLLHCLFPGSRQPGTFPLGSAVPCVARTFLPCFSWQERQAGLLSCKNKVFSRQHYFSACVARRWYSEHKIFPTASYE